VASEPEFPPNSRGTLAKKLYQLDEGDEIRSDSVWFMSFII
jgi:hypothetical protein